MNTYVAPVSEFTRDPDAAMRPEALLAKIRHAAGDAHTAAIDAHAAALALFGDSILSNMFMLGYAWQRGGVPLSHAAINRAIELNGVAVAANRAAFDSGRLAAHQPDALSTALRPRAQVVQLHVPESFEHAVARRLADLTAYQDADYARQYQDVVERVAARERELAPDAKRGWRWRWRAACSSSWPTRTSMKWRGSTLATRSGPSSRTSSKANTACASTWRRRSSRARIAHRRAAQDDAGSAHHDRAQAAGPLRVRGTWLDPFGRTAERKMERALIAEYRQTVDQLLDGLNADKLGQAATIAALAETVRGFGHVKAANVEKYRTELARLMQSYTAPAPRDMPLRKTA